jgi:hypothetical protein
MPRLARISKPAKTAMQSGQAKTKLWLLDLEPADPVEVDPLMGWSGSHDTDKQLRLWFPTKEAAIAFAQARGLSFTVMEPHQRTIRPKSYADNFAFNRART